MSNTLSTSPLACASGYITNTNYCLLTFDHSSCQTSLVIPLGSNHRILFWLASGPPTNTAYQVRNAFDVGWGGAVWKTLTHDPIVNVASRYGGISLNNQRLMGLNNIELISDRPLEDNLREMAEVKKNHPHHALIASVMVESKRETWHNIIKRIQDIGVDGFELNFGCPHGMSERGMVRSRASATVCPDDLRVGQRGGHDSSAG